jgi:hypothetical protein
MAKITWMSPEERTAGYSFADFCRQGNEKPAWTGLNSEIIAQAEGPGNGGKSQV